MENNVKMSKNIYNQPRENESKPLIEIITEEGGILKIPSDRIADFTEETWNPVTGCLYECVYCFARHLIKSQLGESFGKSFRPKLNKPEFTRQFNPGSSVFVTDLGDLFGYWVPKEWILEVLEYIKKFPETKFVLHTKNPSRFLEFDFFQTPNVYIGTTIETNRYYEHITKAPAPILRAQAMEKIPYNKKYITISPLMDFDLDEMVSWIKKIKPEGIEIGANVYEGVNLPEPSWEKVEALIYEVKKICPNVHEKSTLTWLRDRKLPEKLSVCYQSLYYV